MKQVLDHGYVDFVEAWGRGKSGKARKVETGIGMMLEPEDLECGIIEAASQSTQGGFKGWAHDKKLLEYLYVNKHNTPFEFAGMVIEIRAPIFIFREIHRHRTFAFNEMSARYGALPFLDYLPTMERLLDPPDKKNKQAGADTDAEMNPDFVYAWRTRTRDLYQDIEDHYQNGLAIGIRKELARIVLPVGRHSQMRMTGNLRCWLQFLLLRLDPAAQLEIRLFAREIGTLIAEHFPQTWELFKERK